MRYGVVGPDAHDFDERDFLEESSPGVSRGASVEGLEDLIN